MQLFSADAIVFSKKYRTTKSPLMQDWVFRLGLQIRLKRKYKPIPFSLVQISELEIGEPMT